MGMRSFVAMTSDPVHSLIRMSFRCLRDEEMFQSVVQAAEACNSKQMNCGRQSSAGRRSSIGAGYQAESDTSQLCAHLAVQHQGAFPLVFGGADLYGPDPYGSDGGEVLLGRGAVVLLDPPEERRVGNYELLFFDEGNLEPMMRLPIGPRMRLVEQHDDCIPDRLTLAKRASMGRPCLAAAFDLEVCGELARALTFDIDEDAAGFRRDFAVRQRLVSLSLKTWQGSQALDMLKEECYALHASGVFATLRRWLFKAIFLLAVAVLLNTLLLCSASGSRRRAPMDALTESLSEAQHWLVYGAETVLDVGTSACQVVSRSVPVAAVTLCIVAA